VCRIVSWFSSLLVLLSDLRSNKRTRGENSQVPTSMKTENRAERVRTRLATVGRKRNAQWNESQGTKSLLQGSHLLGIEAAE
jgi:hypothetical protein